MLVAVFFTWSLLRTVNRELGAEPTDLRDAMRAVADGDLTRSLPCETVAADAAQALNMARDVYTRRQEGVSIWVVPAKSITASNPDDKGPLFDPAGDKIYRQDETWVTIDSIERIDENVNVVNINVESQDTYFADGILVHNLVDPYQEKAIL